MAHKNTRVLSHDKVENKLFKASVSSMNEGRIHRNMKIARDDNTAKLGCALYPNFIIIQNKKFDLILTKFPFSLS